MGKPKMLSVGILIVATMATVGLVGCSRAQHTILKGTIQSQTEVEN
jgi:hypothetical protein